MADSTLPVIDLSDFERRKPQIAQDLFEAFRDIGFCYVSGHDVSDAEVAQCFEEGKHFFDLNDEQKAQYGWVPDRYLGWRGQQELSQVTGNSLWEWASFGRYGLGGYDVDSKTFLGSRWPPELGQRWADACLAFQAKTHRVALLIIEALALALHERGICDVPLQEFDQELEENPSLMAWNYYPSLEGRTASTPRLFGHADMDCLTLLYQREAPKPGVTSHADVDCLMVLYHREGDRGLEIAPGKDVDDDPELQKVGNAYNAVPVAKRWIPVDPRPGCITVNIGDGLAWWSDGVLKSTYHRVRSPRGDDPRGSRYSMPYFVNPRLSYVFQGPKQRYPALSGFDLLSKTGRAYDARKTDSEGRWKEKAYRDDFKERPAEVVAES